jgi:hypothetical protein
VFLGDLVTSFLEIFGIGILSMGKNTSKLWIWIHFWQQFEFFNGNHLKGLLSNGMENILKLHEKAFVIQQTSKIKKSIHVMFISYKKTAVIFVHENINSKK